MSSNGKSDKALRTIGEVADDLGVATHVLRFWESKFHQIKPQKRRGRRYYRPEDVTIITKIKELLYENGYTIRGVQKYLLEETKNKGSNQSEQSNQEASPAQTAPLNPALFNNQAPSAQGGEFTSFKTDMFGNIVPANSGAVAGVGNQKLNTPLAQPSNESNQGYGEEDIKRLEEIYSGLQNARKRLKDVA
jgi:DNA-binding transcriptional MerR regulator